MKSFLLFVILAITCVSAVKFTDCGTTLKDLQLKVSNCGDSDDVCPFYIGENVTINADFVAVNEIKSAKVKLFGKLGPISVPFKLQPDEVCGNWQMVCPVEAGQKSQLQISVPILSSYKPVKVGVRFELWADKTKLICTQFPAKLVKKS